MSGLLETNIKSLPFVHRGKVRDIYAVGDDKLLVVQNRSPVGVRRGAGRSDPEQGADPDFDVKFLVQEIW